MSTKSQALERLREQMYEHISSVKGNFSELSNIEKAIFFQQAFNNVDKYCTTKWNTKSTPFGFIIGRAGSLATTFGGLNAITANVGYVINSKDAEDIYKTLLHEERHIRQFKTKGLTNQVQRLFSSFLRNKDGSKSPAQWNASPMEIQADNFSYKEMIKMNKAMLKNPETRVQAAQNIRELRIARVKNAYQHVKGVVQVAANPFLSPLQRLFGRDRTQNDEVGKVSREGMRVLNLRELTDVFAKNPNNFTPQGNSSDGAVIRSYIAAKGDQAHFVENFFGQHREYNQYVSQQALNQFAAQHNINPNDEHEIALTALATQNNAVNPGGLDAANEEAVVSEDKVEEESATVVEGSPALKDQIINNIVASRSADKEITDPTLNPDLNAGSETATVETAVEVSAPETSVDIGGMSQ